jgi:hypothetical protein
MRDGMRRYRLTIQPGILEATLGTGLPLAAAGSTATEKRREL